MEDALKPWRMRLWWRKEDPALFWGKVDTIEKKKREKREERREYKETRLTKMQMILFRPRQQHDLLFMCLSVCLSTNWAFSSQRIRREYMEHEIKDNKRQNGGWW